MTASASVTQAVLLRCRTPSGRRTTLAYADLDPYAVRVVFHGPRDDVAWLVDRELLIGGLEASAGEGDVRVRPRRGGEAIEIRFRSPDGSLTTTLPGPTSAPSWPARSRWSPSARSMWTPTNC